MQSGPDSRPKPQGQQLDSYAEALEVAGVHVRSWQVGYRGPISAEDLNGLRLDNFDPADPDLPLTLVAIDDGTICGFVAFGPA